MCICTIYSGSLLFVDSVQIILWSYGEGPDVQVNPDLRCMEVVCPGDTFSHVRICQ